MSTPEPALIRLQNLTLGYGRHPAVHHLSCDIAAGTLLAIIGPNGAGKSTLLKGLAGELRPLGGHILMPAVRRRDLAYLPQHADIDASFPLTVFDAVAMGLWSEIGALRGLSARHRERIDQALQAVGLENFERRQIATLSGGQLQRARFARLLLQDARVLLLDEPFAAVDSRTVEDLLRIIHDWHADGRTVLCIVHDLELVKRHFPTSLLLAREPLAYGATATVLTPALLQRARAHSEAFDEHAPSCTVEEAFAIDLPLPPRLSATAPTHAGDLSSGH